MAKDDFELDLEGFDDSAFDMPGFDGEMGDPEGAGSRSPAMKFGAGFSEGVKDTLTSPQTYATAAEKALPPAYGKLKDKGMEVVDVFSTLKRDATAQLKPEIKKIKKITGKLLPTIERFLPKSISEKLKTFSEEKPGYGAMGETISPDELKIQNTLSEIFNKQQDQRREDIASETAERVYDDQKADQRTDLIIKSQDTTKSLIARLVSYQDNITARFQKESLELQFRHFFVARDLFQVSHVSYKDIILRLDEIKQNTGLPEIQKIHKDEAWKQGIMDEFFGKKGEAVGQILDSYWDSAKANLYAKVKGKMDSALEFVRMPLGAVEEGLEATAGFEGMGASQEEMAGQVAGGFAGEWLVNKIFKPIGEYLRKNETVQKGAVGAEYIVNNLGSVLKEYSSRDYDNKFLNYIAGGIESILPSAGGDREIIEKRLRATGLEPAFYDMATRRSIIEVIPGFLSRIHQGIMHIATGDPNYPRTIFDSTKEEFITLKEAGKSLKEEMAGGYSRRNVQDSLERFYEEFDKDNLLTEAEKQIISFKLLKETDKGITGQFNPEELFEESFYGEELKIKPDTLAKLKTLLGDKYKKTEKGELDITDKELGVITKKYFDIAYAQQNVQEIINQAMAFGESDIMRETGFIGKNEEGEEKFEHDKYRWALLEKELAEEKPLPGKRRKPIRKLGGERTVTSLMPVVESLDITNNLLKEIKLFNEENYFSVDKPFITITDTGYKSVREILEGISVSVNEIKDKDFSLNLPENLKNIKATASVRGIDDFSDPEKVRTFKEDVLKFLEAIEKGTLLNLDATLESTKSLLEGMSKNVEATLESTKLLLAGIGNIKIDDSITQLFKKSITGVTKVTSAGIGGIFKGVGAALGAMTLSIKAGTSLFKDDGISDIYVVGDEEPRLLARKLRKLNYVDVETKKPIQFITDIKNPVCDVTDSMAIIITQEDIDKGFYSPAREGAIRTVGKDIYALGRKMFTGTGGVFAGLISLYKKMGAFAKKIYREVSGITDVYVAGEQQPRLLAVIIRRGGYMSATTGKPIFSLGDIDGPVVDATGKQLLSMEDLPNLYDSKGKKIELSTLSERLMGFFVKTAKGTFELAQKTVVSSFKLAKKMAMIPLGIAKRVGLKAYGKAKSGVKKAVLYLAKKLGYEIKKTGKEDEEVPLAEILASEQINILKKIYKLLDNRIPRRNEIEEGSWQAQYAKKAGSVKENIRDRVRKRREAKTAMSAAMAAGAANEAMGEEKETAVDKVIDTAVDVGTDLTTGAISGGLGLVGSTIAAKVAAAGGVKATAGLALGALKAGAGAALGFVSLPVVAAIGAVGAAGYGAMYLWDRKSPSEIEELRMLQYGVRKNEYNRLAMMREFENFMEDRVTFMDGVVNIKGDANTILRECHEIFDLDVTNQTKLGQWMLWFNVRFSRIYTKHYSAIKEGNLDDFDEIEDQNPISKVEYIKRVSSGNIVSAYRMTYSPFPDGTITIDPLEISNLTNMLLDKYEKEHEELKTAANKLETEEGVKEGEETTTEEEKSTFPSLTGMFGEFTSEVKRFFSLPKLEPDTRPVGLVEKYRLLQYGVNPDDDYQVQPIRALEKYCFENMEFRYDNIMQLNPLYLLKKVVKYFPFNVSDTHYCEAWQFWYANRFLPIYIKYLKFVEKEKIKDLFSLETLASTAKLSILVLNTQPTGLEYNPYEIFTSPFGEYKLSVKPDTIDEFKKYLLNLKAPEKINLNIGSFTPETYKDYQKNMTAKQQTEQSNVKQAEEILKKGGMTQVSRQSSPWKSKEEEKVISLLSPVEAAPNSLFGTRVHPVTGKVTEHKGVDYAAPKGTPIRAAADGKIIRRYHSDSFGNVIFLEHENGLITKYAHMSRFSDEFKIGDIVKTGDIIGFVGDTGRSTGDHLHFELRGGTEPKDKAYDPLAFMKDSSIEPSANQANYAANQTGVGGEDIPIPNYDPNNEIMEDYTQIVTKETETDIKRKTEKLNAQKNLEHKNHMDKLTLIESTLQNQLKVQIDISDYLKSIKENIESFEIPIVNLESEETKPVKKDEAIALKLPTQNSVTPALSMKRRKYGVR